MSSLVKRLREKLAPRVREVAPPDQNKKGWDEFSGRQENPRRIPWGRVSGSLVDEEEEFFGGDISITGSTSGGLTSLPSHTHVAGEITPQVTINPVTNLRYIASTGDLQMERTAYTIILVAQGESVWSTWTTAEDSCDE